jgi:insertion element IS1 protein InsB
LLLEKLPLAGIARAVQVSETLLQEYVNVKYDKVEKQVKVPVKKGL